MAIKKFTQFIAEKQTDKELKNKAEEDLGQVADKCPRCGFIFNDCICSEIDYYSTLNVYRTPKGEIKNEKANNNDKHS